jgi:hypothetical protein
MLGTFEFSVNVLAAHAAADLSGFALAFGGTPRHCSNAGEPIVTPTGARLAGTYATSRCLIELGSQEGGTLSECFERAADLIERQHEAVSRVLNMGGSVELFARWYPDGDTGEVLPPTLLARLGSLGVSLGFNVYGVQPTPAEE